MPVKKFATSLRRNDGAAIYLRGIKKKKKERGCASGGCGEKRLSRDDKGRFTIVRRPWMDIKKTMNVAIERIRDLLTKGPPAGVKYEGRAGKGFRGRRKLIFAILVLRNWLLMFYSSADNGGAEAIPRGEKVVRPGKGQGSPGVTLSLRARRSSFLKELLP